MIVINVVDLFFLFPKPFFLLSIRCDAPFGICAPVLLIE
jgi:hypothetical protein